MQIWGQYEYPVVDMNSHLLDRLDAMQAWFHRQRWWIRLALAILLVPWFGRFACVRMTTLPAKPEANATAFDQLFSKPTFREGSPLKAFADAVPDVMSWKLPAPTTAPAAMRWQPGPSFDADTLQNMGGSCNIMEATAGPWTPATRHHLQTIITHMEDAKFKEGMAKIASLAAQPLALPSMDLFSPGRIRAVCKMLAAHARYCMAQKHDFRTAMRDIKAIFDLGRQLDDVGTFLAFMSAHSCRSMARQELLCWSREFSLTASQAQTAIHLLETHNLDMPHQWNQTILAEGKFTEQALDSFYSKSPDGNGWFVVHPRTTGDAADTALSALNLLSVFLTNRQTLMAKQEVAIRRATLKANVPYEQVGRQLKRKDPEDEGRRQAEKQFNPADGPVFLPAIYGMYASTYDFFVQDMAQHSAAIAALALSAWRTEHGQYPTDLRQLVPDYLASSPADPIDFQPIRYRLDDRDGYSLYSIGGNGIDDGGHPRDDKGELYWGWNAADWTYPGERIDPDVEWYLVAATQPVGQP